MPGQNASARFVVELEGRGVGVLIAERSGYKYFAADRSTSSLDGRRFSSPSAAQNAVTALRSPPRAVEADNRKN